MKKNLSKETGAFHNEPAECQKQSSTSSCCFSIAKIRIFSPRCFFYRRKVLTGASHWHSATTQFPSISFRYASYLMRVGSVVPVCQFLFKDARQRVHSVIVLVCIKVAQKRRYMLVKSLVTLFPPERHYN